WHPARVAAPIEANGALGHLAARWRRAALPNPRSRSDPDTGFVPIRSGPSRRPPSGRKTEANPRRGGLSFPGEGLTARIRGLLSSGGRVTVTERRPGDRRSLAMAYPEARRRRRRGPGRLAAVGLAACLLGAGQGPAPVDGPNSEAPPAVLRDGFE